MNDTLNVVAAWLGVALGLISLVRPWWRGRQANPGAQLDLLETQSGQEERVVLTNQGPAEMRIMKIDVLDEDGKSLTLTTPDVFILWPKMPVEHLGDKQSLPLTLNRSLGTSAPKEIEITWQDRRRGEQKRRIALSYNRVTSLRQFD